MIRPLLLCLVLFPVCSSSVDAAITITITPDGSGGTTYSFSQTLPNPTTSVELAAISGARIDLPRGMFDPIVSGGPGYSDTTGGFDMIARFQDAGSGITYDVVTLTISNVLSYAFFGFQIPFSAAPGQTSVQFDLLPSAPVGLGISPDVLVEGTHLIGSALFGTVTVNVIPEPSSLSMLLLSTVALMKRRRRNTCRTSHLTE